MMNKQYILGKYREIGIAPQTKYLRSDRVEKYREIADVLIREAYGGGYTESLELSDLESMIVQRAEKQELSDSEAIKAVSEDIKLLSSYINRYRAGDSGEERARKALQMFYREHCKLHNVFLSNEKGSAEYDSIVISPRGVFIIEVKNIATDVFILENGDFYKRSSENKPEYLGNLAESLERKRYVLWATLSDDIREKLYIDDIHPVALFVGRGIVKNDMKWLDVCYCGDICRYIENYYNRGRRIFIEDMERIYRLIDSVSQPHLWELDIDIEKLAADFSEAMELVSGKETQLPDKHTKERVSVVPRRLDTAPHRSAPQSVAARRSPFKQRYARESSYVVIMPFSIAARAFRRYYKNTRHI